jgi:hypothetical protein
MGAERQSDQAIRDIVAQLVGAQAAPQQAAPVVPMGYPVPARSNFATMPFLQQPDSQFPPPVSGNSIAAARDLNLSPQEQALYARHLTNLGGPGGVTNPPDAQNPQGSRSTLYAGVEPHDGKFYNVPTVWDGKREVQPYTRTDGSTLDVANPTALANVAKAGWDTFPSYATPNEADARYQAMHDYMEKDTADYLKGR